MYARITDDGIETSNQPGDGWREVVEVRPPLPQNHLYAGPDLTVANGQVTATWTTRPSNVTKREAAIARLLAFANAGAAPTAAQVRTEAQFTARVLARVLATIDIDPDA